jgi:NADPH-dependent 2,4-dienoyl-CoA reductase/sulfur reductase-like enzyme
VLRRIAVVGASLAGLRAVEALRREGYDGELCLIGGEPHVPYDRPPLSKQVLRGEWAAERIRLHGADQLAALSIEVRTGVRAVALDATRRVLELEDGSELGYDGLVIATGATPRRLPFGSGLAGVHVLRSLDDALAIGEALRARPRVCVIGAGFIGLEVAASCRTLGLDVHAVEPLPLPLAGKLGERMAQLIVDLHVAHGVQMHCGVAVTALVGDARVERVVLADGRKLDADLVVVGIGVRPEVQWLASSGVHVGDGVLCDAACATNAPDVVACGDVARFHHAQLDEALRIEHWTNAVEMANHAVLRLLGGAQHAQPFTPVPYFWSDQYDVKIQFAGSLHSGDALELIEHAPQDGKLLVLFGRGDRLSGVLAWNRPAQLVRYRRAISAGTEFSAAVAQARA